jgi:CheY-like chemotaxis protein
MQPEKTYPQCPNLEWIDLNATKHVLIIDDESVILEVVQNCLEDVAGWQVSTARSGREGLAKALVELPDAILLDIAMPGMDGVAVRRRLRTDAKTRSIPVVVLTGQVEFTDPQRIQDLGLAGAISKPCEPFQLVQQLADFLGWSLQYGDGGEG